MRILLLGLAIFCNSYSLMSQQISSEVLADSAMLQVKRLYNSSRGNDAAIYNGINYYFYPGNIEGSPYLRAPAWQRGRVIYENILYEDILMRYDQVRDQLLVTPDETRPYQIGLFSPRVKEFSYAGMKFVWMDPETASSLHLKEGFYLVLGEGKAAGYARVRKQIDEKVELTGVYRKFLETTQYYIIRDGDTKLIKNKGHLLDALKEKRNEIQRLLGKGNANFKQNTEGSIIAALKLFNQTD
jgi:hypothetical protein